LLLQCIQNVLQFSCKCHGFYTTSRESTESCMALAKDES
jgi:hypothetical protein